MGNDRAGAGASTTSGPGYALLLAGPAGKQRLMDAAAALSQLAAVPPAALLGTPGGASVVQLVDPADPQTVLTHLRTAAAAPGAGAGPSRGPAHPRRQTAAAASRVGPYDAEDGPVHRVAVALARGRTRRAAPGQHHGAHRSGGRRDGVAAAGRRPAARGAACGRAHAVRHGRPGAAQAAGRRAGLQQGARRAAAGRRPPSAVRAAAPAGRPGVGAGRRARTAAGRAGRGVPGP